MFYTRVHGSCFQLEYFHLARAHPGAKYILQVGEARTMGITYGMIIGIIYVAAPGPISIETLKYGVKGGFTAALAVQIGSSVGLIVYALLSLLGAGLLFQEDMWQLLAAASGMIVLLYLGITTIRDGRNLFQHSDIRTLRLSSTRRAFSTGAILSLANPLDFVFWLSISSRVLMDPGLESSVFLGGLFVGCILTSISMAFLAGFWQSRLSSKVVLAISWACGLVMIGFGFNLALSLGRHLVAW
jgi:threonine/homoserine/homoserine lactone efflux protein